MAVPLTRPNPPRLSEHSALLREIEHRGIYSNFGPVNTALEQDLTSRMFAGEGSCMTVNNATIGLMLAVQHAIGDRPVGRRYALMPAFTFAAAAQAAMWCGLVPLFCDIDPDSWAACPVDEERLLAQYGGDIAVVMPYATFGYDIDLSRYAAIKARYGVPTVVDAAASLGTASADGRGFGAGFGGSVVFSMHATKSFATGEAGIIYSVDQAAIAQMRQMCNFGFGKPRNATMLGLNGKLSEVGALLAQLRLADYDGVVAHREGLLRGYRHALPGLTFQSQGQGRQAHQFASALLPRTLTFRRAEVAAALAEDGIGSAAYFSPHLAQQDYFMEHATFGSLPVTDNVGSRIISLPLFDAMTRRDLDEVTSSMQRVLARLAPPARRQRSRSSLSMPPLVLPAGAAFLDAGLADNRPDAPT